MGAEEAVEKEQQQGIVAVNPKPGKGLVSKAVDLIERAIVYLMHDSSKPLYYLSGNFAPVRDETPPCFDIPVRGSLPVNPATVS
ncbi:putative Carotenoid 9,10(9',10')-cleavage dioxygenase [Cocos nucifera]|nr:putative Carotenoid 9,10(9',10')-cleavage dioxygenase [Cocos nucifera]